MERFIKLDTESQERIAKIFNITTRSVRSALTWTTDSEQARKIRYIALEQYNGKLFVEVKKNIDTELK